MGIILFILAFDLILLFSIQATLHTIVAAFRYKKGFKYIDDRYYQAAIALDIFANVAFGTMFNDWFIKKGGYHYGQFFETLSAATGKNWLLRKLNFLGLGLAGSLNLVDYKNWKTGGHILKAVKDEEFLALGWNDDIKWYHTVVFLLVFIPLLPLCIKLILWLV